MHVLIAEDEEFNQMVLQDMLLLLYPGITMDIVNNGVEAMEMLEKETHYDMILSDVGMPVMNGYDFVIKARKELNITLPIISVTAFTIRGDKEKLLECGFDDYVAKPIDMNELKRVIDKYI